MRPITFLLCIPLLAVLSLAFQGWQRPAQPGLSSPLIAVTQDPDTSAVLVASRDKVFKAHDLNTWEPVWTLTGRGSDEITEIMPADPDSGEFFVLTSNGIYLAKANSAQWVKIYNRRNKAERSVRSLLVSEDDPLHWFAGTGNGIFETDNGGNDWWSMESFPGRDTVIDLAWNRDELIAMSGSKIYRSADLIHFEEIFRGPVSIPEEEIESMEAEPAYEQVPYLFDLLSHTGTLWAATREGVIQRTKDNEWRGLSKAGLREASVLHLAYAPQAKSLFAAGRNAVYRFYPQEDRWQELYQGLTGTDIRDIEVVQGDNEVLIVVTEEGVSYLPVFPEQPVSYEAIISPDEVSLFQNLIALEPSVRDVQRWVVDYSNTPNSKINGWHKQSRVKSLLPSFSIGYDKSEDNNVDLDRGSTSDPDVYIFGPDDISRGFDMDMSWDLGDLIFSSSQTSIDSREKIMVELRHDLLQEATRVYHERRREQIEMLFHPPQSLQEHYLRLTRLEELTALLDAMTGRRFSGKLFELYENHPGLERLWHFGEEKTILVTASSNLTLE